MSNHTPGPWERSEIKGYYAILRSANKCVLAWLDGAPDHDTDAANARLIAQAPAMLAILKPIAEEWIDNQHVPLIAKLIEDARAILARIEGKQPRVHSGHSQASECDCDQIDARINGGTK